MSTFHCHRIRPSPRPCVTFHYMLFYSEHLDTRRTPYLEDHPLSAVRDCILSIFAAIPNIWGRFLQPQPEDAPCLGEKGLNITWSAKCADAANIIHKLLCFDAIPYSLKETFHSHNPTEVVFHVCQFNFLQITFISVGSEVRTAVVMKSSVFWDITPCSLLKVNDSKERVASIFRVEDYVQARNQREAVRKQSSKLHGVISQKTELHFPNYLYFKCSFVTRYCCRQALLITELKRINTAVCQLTFSESINTFVSTVANNFNVADRMYVNVKVELFRTRIRLG
jgi:hypothetical protein